jgi:hypothetical protein
MRSGAKIAVCFLGAVVSTVIAGAIALPSLAKTGDNDVPVAFVFPYALFIIYFREGADYGWLLALGLPQFFVYAALFAWAWVFGDDDDVLRLWIRIGVLHLLLGVGCAALYSLES